MVTSSLCVLIDTRSVLNSHTKEKKGKIRALSKNIFPFCLFSPYLILGWWHVDCEGDIGWVPASFIMPVLGDNNNESIVTEIFPAGKGNDRFIIS